MNDFVVLDEFELPVRFNEYDVVGGSLEDCQKWLNYNFDCHDGRYGTKFFILETRSAEIVSTHGWCSIHGCSFEGVCDICYQGVQILLADPPWHYKVWSEDTGAGRSASAHYQTMTIDQIAGLPVQDVMAKNAVLLLWATYPCLPEALALGKAWGFTYKTVAFTWIKETTHGKDHVGMGYYTRANPEPVLLFGRGKPLKRVSKAVRNLQRHKIGRHSEKPRAIHDEIHRLFGPLHSMELFAREPRDGWICLGNEISGKSIDQELRDYAEHLKRQ